KVKAVFEGDQGVKLNTGSTASIVVSELSTMIDRKLYNTGLIQKLTSLYDSMDGDGKITKSGGEQTLRNIYVTLAGGTTPKEMKTGFPQEAIGGGFVSRTIFVYVSRATRSFAVPPTIPDLPDVNEMAQRLAWIMDTAAGEYRLSQEAFSEHERWYNE